MKESNIKLTAIFLLSAAIIAYELAVMRSFSVGSWSNFGSMVISIALLGFGLAGTFLTFVQNHVKKNADKWLFISALVFPPAMVFAHILAQQVPFNPVLIVSDPVQIWWIGAYYLIYAVPFVSGAFFIGVAFIALSGKIHELYFWNMVGSGVGGFFILFCMYFFPSDYLAVPILVISFTAVLLCLYSKTFGQVESRNNQKSFYKNILISAETIVVVLVCIIFFRIISDYLVVPILIVSFTAMLLGAKTKILGEFNQKVFVRNSLIGAAAIGATLVCIIFFRSISDYLVIPIMIVSFTAVIFSSYTKTPGSVIQKPFIRDSLISSGTIVAALVCIVFFGKISVSDYKSVSYVRKYPEFSLDYFSFSPLGEMHVYSSSYLHFAPGLSDNASSELEQMPAKAFKGLYIDGGGPIGIMRKLDKTESGYIDYLPMSAPYHLMKNPEVLLINLGGGAGIFTALYHHAQKVTAIEPNPELVRLLKSVPVIKEFNGNLLSDPAVDVHYGEPRAFCAGTKQKFDLVELSLIDSVGLSQTGGYPVTENFTYTVEGFQDYMRTLKQSGILSITVWNKLSPPRNVPRLLSTVVSVLKADKNIRQPEKRIFMFQMLLQTATVLVKNSDFTGQEIAVLNEYCKKMSFTVSYYPGMPEKNDDFDRILTDYAELFSKPKTYEIEIEDGEKGSGNLLTLMNKVSEQKEDDGELDPAALYHFSLFRMLVSGGMKELFQKYIFDIRPATDDRPYYTAYLKPQTVGMFLPQMNKVSEEWGYLMLLGTLVQSLIFGALIILMPLIGRRKELFKKRKGTLGVILYYACLGLGYMLIEIYLTQKLVFFLENPIFSLSIVITSMLVLSGIGSLFSNRFKTNPQKGIIIAAAGTGASIIFYIFALTPLLKATLGFPFIIKFFLAVLFIAPGAFFLGIPFPSGLSSLSKNREGLIPWAWGMNGALSVTGSVLARLFSVSFGFLPVLLTALGLYVLAGFLFQSNCVSDKAG